MQGLRCAQPSVQIVTTCGFAADEFALCFVFQPCSVIVLGFQLIHGMLPHLLERAFSKALLAETVSAATDGDADEGASVTTCF